MILLWAVVALAEPGWEPVLEDEAYRFCNEPGAQAEVAREWCELLASVPPERCPGMHATCAGAPPRQDVRDLMEQIRGCGDDASGRRMAEAPVPPPKGCESEQQPESCANTPGSSPAAAAVRWIAAIAVAVLILVIIRLLAGWWSGRDPKPAGVRLEDALTRVMDDPDAIPDLPSDDLLGAARRALAEGRYAEAVLLARATALRRLGEAGRIVLHRARTDREYARAVREEPDVHAPLREILGAVETHRWGGRTVGSEAAEATLYAAERVIAAVGAALLVIALLEADAHADRYDPYGDAAIRDLYDRGGYDVSWRLRGLHTLAVGDTDVLVLDLDQITVDETDIEAVRAWVTAGGVLIVGGDASAMFPELGEYVADEDFDEDTDNDSVTEFSALDAPTGAVVAPGAPFADAPRWSMGIWAHWEPAGATVPWVLIDDDTAANAAIVALRHGGGGVIAIADARLLCNGALVALENEVFLLRAPYAGHDDGLWRLPVPARIQLATRSGADSQDPCGTIARAQMLPAVLQLLLVAVIVAVWRGAPFAPLKDPPELGRLAFVEHVRVLGTRYLRLGASRRAYAASASLWLGRLGRNGAVQAGRRAGLDAAAATALVDAAEAAARDPSGPDTPTDLANLEELWRIVQHRP